jgi:hypothetical protein
LRRGCVAILNLGLVVACFSLLACAGSKVDPSKLPGQPIALSWWDNEDGRRRRDMLNDESTRKTPYLMREGVAELGRMQDLLSRGEEGDVEARFPGRLVLLDPRTREITRVEQAPPGSRPLGWSDDGRRLLFATDRLSGKYQVYQVDIESGELHAVTRGRAHHIAADFGKGRDAVYEAVDTARAGEVEARILLSDGGRKGKTIEEDVVVRHLAFAPDSSAIAYARMNAGGAGRASGVTEVMVRAPVPDARETNLGAGDHPVFTPDSAWVVYSVPATGGSRLKRARPDGSGRTSVGKAVRSEETPAVSPDGGYVVYVSEYNGLDRLFIKRFDGTGDRLLYDGGEVRGPIW